MSSSPDSNLLESANRTLSDTRDAITAAARRQPSLCQHAYDALKLAADDISRGAWRPAYGLLQPVVSYFLDIASDTLLAVSYFNTGHALWGFYTMGVVVGSAWLIGYYEIQSTIEEVVREHGGMTREDGERIVLAMLGLGQLTGHLEDMRRFASFRLRHPDEDPDEVTSVSADHDLLTRAEFYNLVEMYFESIPQLCLQLYIVLSKAIHGDSDVYRSTQFYLQLFSMAGSLSGIASATAAVFSRHNMSTTGRRLITWALTCSTISRCACLATAAIFSPVRLVFCLAAVHGSYYKLQLYADEQRGRSRTEFTVFLSTAPLVFGLAPLSRSRYVATDLYRWLVSLLINSYLLSTVPLFDGSQRICQAIVAVGNLGAMVGLALKMTCLWYHHPLKDELNWHHVPPVIDLIDFVPYFPKVQEHLK